MIQYLLNWKIYYYKYKFLFIQSYLRNSSLFDLLNVNLLILDSSVDLMAGGRIYLKHIDLFIF